MELLRQELQRL